ncbi:follicle-stimulating hormone receptor precursor [Danio rerio]|uniref:Thyrotropin receptor n=1 Tax=Danio rerio TaxID=7955 RepID=Q6TCF9_DANRE|nr:follicle-stimulating hormone receptor precursor [Danio rerio]AAR84280.1 follicle-stimulating hormone receptor [Danio rerio]|eukprot:NP_001001812.1 follicle-stimulating hormone receptor precursor [Danio rerio]
MVLSMMLCFILGCSMANTEDTLAASQFCAFNGSTRSFVCLGNKVLEIPRRIPTNTTFVEIKLTQISVFRRAALSELHELKRIVVSENGALERIEALAFFNLTELEEITITKSKNLVMHKDAFWRLPKLRYLTISNTGLKILPDFSKINSAALEFLFDLQDNMHIERIPSNAFLGLTNATITELRLTKNGIREIDSHAFNGTKIGKLFLMGNQQLNHIHSYAFKGAEGPVVLDISRTAVHTLPESMLKTLKLLMAVSVYSLRKLPSLELFTELTQANLTYPSHCCAFKNFKKHKSVKNQMCNVTGAHEEPDFFNFFNDHCKDVIEVTCYPTPDAFNPCEDIMGFTFLRVLIWFISVLAIVGNTVVLLVLLTSRYKLTVPRFLMCHLAFADLCMGIYLLLIAAVDIHTQSRYYNYGIDWQTGAGCHVAGFFTVFSSELSVYTLTAITLERWHTITYAMQLERQMRLRHACLVMATGWLFSLLAALMPMFGVSSYSKTSICLPMDVETLLSQGYVVLLLLLNAAAFLVVCVCYTLIYLTVRNPAFVPANADMRIAKRMAVLIFTDFLCMAPISFFAISAAFKLPLITASHAKVLLVLFYPINSCSNPFLYAFFTKTFKRDFFILTSRFGCFKRRAHIYCTEISSGQNGAVVPSPKTSDGTLYSLVHIAQVH